MRDTVVNCSQCGEPHALEDLELSFRRPDAIVELPDEKRKELVIETDDLCTINWERFFVRAILPLPVFSQTYPYQIGMWAEVDGDVFNLVRELWDDPSQNRKPPFEALLANEIPLLPTTCGLSAKLQLTGPTTRPSIVITPCEHPLYGEQTEGITAHRAFEYSSYFA
jgi:hypothetical protein